MTHDGRHTDDERVKCSPRPVGFAAGKNEEKQIGEFISTYIHPGMHAEGNENETTQRERSRAEKKGKKALKKQKKWGQDTTRQTIRPMQTIIRHFQRLN